MLITKTAQVVIIDSLATGESMRQSRILSGLSLREISRRMCLSAPYLSDLERGKRNWTKKLANRYEDAIISATAEAAK